MKTISFGYRILAISIFVAVVALLCYFVVNRQRLAHRDDFPRERHYVDTGQKNPLGESLNTAIKSGDLEAVKLLLSRGADPSYHVNAEMPTPLKNATRANRADIVEVLINAGADPNENPVISDPVIKEAVVMDSWQVAEVLLRRGAPSQNLLKHCKSVEMAKILIQYGANPEGDGPAPDNPLVFIAYENNIELVKYLLEIGVDPNVLDDGMGSTAIMMASGYGYDELIQILLHHGAKVYKANRVGFTALHKAAVHGSMSTVKILLASGADPRAISDWKTPADQARYQKHYDVAEYLDNITKKK